MKPGRKTGEGNQGQQQEGTGRTEEDTGGDKGKGETVQMIGKIRRGKGKEKAKKRGRKEDTEKSRINELKALRSSTHEREQKNTSVKKI